MDTSYSAAQSHFLLPLATLALGRFGSIGLAGGDSKITPAETQTDSVRFQVAKHATGPHVSNQVPLKGTTDFNPISKRIVTHHTWGQPERLMIERLGSYGNLEGIVGEDVQGMLVAAGMNGPRLAGTLKAPAIAAQGPSFGRIVNPSWSHKNTWVAPVYLAMAE